MTRPQIHHWTAIDGDSDGGADFSTLLEVFRKDLFDARETRI
jgi:hypothetical protein